MSDCPNIADDSFAPIDAEALFPAARSSHAPRILILYGSLRERSFSRFSAEEAGRVLEKLGADRAELDRLVAEQTTKLEEIARACIRYEEEGIVEAMLYFSAPFPLSTTIRYCRNIARGVITAVKEKRIIRK